MNQELPDVQAEFRKGRGTRDQIVSIRWMLLLEIGRDFQKKTSTSVSLTTLKFLTVDHTNCGKYLKIWEYQTTLPASCKTGMQVKKQQLELDKEQWTDSKLVKKYIKAVYCHPAHLTYMQSASCEMSSWMKHRLESRLQGKMSITSDMQMAPPLWQKVKRN